MYHSPSQTILRSAAQRSISICRGRWFSTATRRSGQNPLFPGEAPRNSPEQGLDALLNRHRAKWVPHGRTRGQIEQYRPENPSQNPNGLFDKHHGNPSLEVEAERQGRPLPVRPRRLIYAELRDAEWKLFDPKTLPIGINRRLRQRFRNPEWFLTQFTNVLSNSETCITLFQRALYPHSRPSPWHLPELLSRKLRDNIDDTRTHLEGLRSSASHRQELFRLISERARLRRHLAALKPRRTEIQVPIDLQSQPDGVYNATAIAMRKQHQIDSAGRHKRRKIERKAPSVLETCSPDDVLGFEVEDLLRRPRQERSADLIEAAQEHETTGTISSDKDFCNIVLDIEELSATGEGLARHPTLDLVYVVPFTLPGERVKANVPVKPSAKNWSNADLIQVLEHSALREGTTPQCKYFGECSGCQLQMIPYSEQLKHKKTIVEKAYRNFSGLSTDQLPPVADTGSSPLQYGYRTKLTPHFDGPRKSSLYFDVPPIGFTRKGFRRVMDIESCPIGTPIVQEGLRIERAKVAANIKQYKRGATILLRESTERTVSKSEPSDETPADSLLPSHSLDALPQPNESSPEIESSSTGPSSTSTYTINSATITDIKTYTTNNTAQSLEQIGSYTFSTRAGSFFQNNNSILPSFLSHVRELAQPASPAAPLKYLLDAYCGSGLFALTLSPSYTSVLGIELDVHGVTSARENATRNHISNAGFIEADAAALFADVPFPAAQTALVIDPPRKGCSVDFLRQLLRYGPQRVIYVSCNVNSQARDVGCLVKGVVGDDFWNVSDSGRGSGSGRVEVGRWRYVVESLQGWDFFPQTGHVEGLCVLSRVENEAWEDEKKGKKAHTEDDGGKSVENAAAAV